MAGTYELRNVDDSKVTRELTVTFGDRVKVGLRVSAGTRDLKSLERTIPSLPEVHTCGVKVNNINGLERVSRVNWHDLLTRPREHWQLLQAVSKLAFESQEGTRPGG